MVMARRYLMFAIFVAMVFGLMFTILNMQTTQIDRPLVTQTTTAVCPTTNAQLYPTNSRFVVTRNSKVYSANPDPSCWIPDCKLRNNHKAYRECTDAVAADWNTLGVLSMERYLAGPLSDLPDYNDKSLVDAIWYFSNATSVQPSCGQAWLNLGIARMQARQYDAAGSALSKAADIFQQGDDAGTAHMFWGLTDESTDRRNDAIGHYDKARASSLVQRTYSSILLSQDRKKELTSYNSIYEAEALRSFATFVYFSPTSIGGWALLKPGTQDWFLENRYIVMRKVVPPFLLAASSKFFRQLIDNKVLNLGDTQSQRYVAYNDRIGRFLHNHLTHMVRRITAHNAKPSYTYFGGYVGGASLKAHTDRSQCEFTISLNLEHFPHNKTWLLSLDKLPLFDKDGQSANRAANVMTDKEENIADADLYAGDALLFMGRHLIHFRRGALPEGEWTNQAFLHYVKEDFEGDLN